jgi:hypothetical protein
MRTYAISSSGKHRGRSALATQKHKAEARQRIQITVQGTNQSLLRPGLSLPLAARFQRTKAEKMHGEACDVGSHFC